jgi:CspA family cold shock protein
MNERFSPAGLRRSALHDVPFHDFTDCHATTAPHARGSRAATFISGTERMPSGTVKFFNMDKGYGFIRPDDGTKDVFVHISAVEHSGLHGLQEGQKVTFELQPDKKGPKAVNLVVE